MEPKRQKLDLEIVSEANYDAWNFNDFPNEVIVKIFSFLTQNQLAQIARVCRRWSVLTKSPVLWRKVDVKFFRSSDSGNDAKSFNSFIDGLPSCVTFIKLDFVKRGCVDTWWLNFEKLCTKLHQNNPNVEALILARCSISTNLTEVINSCTQFLQGLKKLVFNYCHFKSYPGTTELEHNSKIEVLDLIGSGFSDTSKMQFSKLPSLTELRLSTTPVNDAWFVGDISFLNQLHMLDLGGTGVTASTFTAILGHGQNLKELYLCFLHRLDDNDFNFNGPAFPQLKTICLWNTSVTCEGLVSLVRSCPSLVSVYVREHLARSFSEHPFVVANRCKSGIVKGADGNHDHNVDYLHN